MPLEALDIRLNHLMGDEFGQRDERRGIFKANRDKSLAHRAAKHLDRKQTQQMQGSQLLEGAKRYAPHIISALPQHVQDQIKIGKINKEGHTTLEKNFASDLEAVWQERRRKKVERAEQQLDLEDFDELAKTTMSEHDKNWGKRGDIKLSSITEKIATKSHFNSVSMKEDAFFNELIEVLPFLGESMNPPIKNNKEAVKQALKKPPYKTKSSIMKPGGIVGTHLDLIKLIAKGKAENEFEVDLTNKTEDEILQTFIDATKSIKLNEITTAVEDKWKLMEDIFESAATEIKPRYAKLMHQEPKDVEAEEDDEITE